jgi:hypothetical protein
MKSGIFHPIVLTVLTKLTNTDFEHSEIMLHPVLQCLHSIAGVQVLH